MSTLTGQYISQSYGGLIQLSTNTGIVTGSFTQLQDGLGTNLGVYLNGQGDISAADIRLTGSIYTQPIGPFTFGVPSIIPFSVLEGDYPSRSTGKFGNIIMTTNASDSSTGSIVLSGSNNIFYDNAGASNGFISAGWGAGVRATNSIIGSTWYTTGSNGSGYNRPAWPELLDTIANGGWQIADNRSTTSSTGVFLSRVINNSFANVRINSGSISFTDGIINGNSLVFADDNSTNNGGLTISQGLISGRGHSIIANTNLTFGFGGIGTHILGYNNALLLSGSTRRADGVSIIGYQLSVTGSEAVDAQYGATYVGKYNATDSTSIAGNTAFAVGTGVTGSRRTSLHVSSSGLTTISDGLRLTPQNPLPSGSVGTLAVSGSNLYYHNGTSWSQIN